MTKRATPCVEATNASARFLDRDDDASPSPPRPKTAAYVGLAAVQLSYCVWHVLGKIALNGGANPFVLALYRQLGACACLYVLARCVDYRSGGLGDALKALSRRQRRRFVLLGFLGFCNIFGFVVALSYVTAFNSALLHPIIPVIAAAAAAAAGIERATPPKAAGVALAASGALVVVVAGGSGGGESNPDASPASVAFGNAILLGQCGAMGCLLVLQKSILNDTRLPATTTTFTYNVVAAAIALVATPAFVGSDVDAYALTDGPALLATAYRRGADDAPTNRGGAAAATWIFRGDESRRRRGGDVDIPWRRVAARTFLR